MEKYIVAKANDGADDDHQKKYADKFIPFKNSHSCTDEWTGEIADGHGDSELI